MNSHSFYTLWSWNFPIISSKSLIFYICDHKLIFSCVITDHNRASLFGSYFYALLFQKRVGIALILLRRILMSIGEFLKTCLVCSLIERGSSSTKTKCLVMRLE